MAERNDVETGGGGAEAGWPPELDALVAAPANHKLLLENERIRVLDTVIRAGDTAPLHTHRWPCAMVVRSFSHFVRRDGEGRVMVDSRTVAALRDPPTTLWSEPLPPHTLENVGDRDLHVISVELKDQS